MGGEKVLIIEDEKNILELFRFNLDREGYKPFTAIDGEDGLNRAKRDNPDLIILDLMLPGVDGVEICKILKDDYKTSRIPIIMVTAKSQETDVVLGLELGADDYVAKPFSPKQLMARIKAVLRRYKPGPQEQVYRTGELELDTAKHSVSLSGKNIELTFKEYSILKLFFESNGRVLSRESILDQVWGHDESLNVDFRAVDKHIAELRKKIHREAHRILTIKNFGYRFNLES